MVWPVPALGLSVGTAELGAEQLAHVPAVRLFMERAHAVLPTFTLSDSTAPLVADVCRRLDGLPLALELAAARLRALSIEELATRLDNRFQMLVGGSRTAPPRQQTLRATLDWSFEMLATAERTLIMRREPFAGGFTIQAAESVCAGDDLSENEILDVLVGLVDRSMVVAQPLDRGGVRYHLLESVRQYALERFSERNGDELRAARRRHASFYRAMAANAERALLGPNPSACMSELSAELGNMRAVLE
jgi:predicted ATPase